MKNLIWQNPEQQKVAQDFVMSDFLLTLVLHLKTSKIINGMAKVSIKYEKITPLGGIFHVRELFPDQKPFALADG